MQLAGDVPAFRFLRLHQPAGERLELVAVHAALRFGPTEAGVLFHLQHGAAHGGHQPPQPFFQHVVGGAALEGFNRPFLAHRAGQQDERHGREFFPHEGQRRQPVETGQREIGEDQIKLSPVQRLDELRPAGHQRDAEGDALTFERAPDQFRVGRLILEMQDTERGFHSPVRVGCFANGRKMFPQFSRRRVLADTGLACSNRRGQHCFLHWPD